MNSATPTAATPMAGTRLAEIETWAAQHSESGMTVMVDECAAEIRRLQAALIAQQRDADERWNADRLKDMKDWGEAGTEIRRLKDENAVLKKEINGLNGEVEALKADWNLRYIQSGEYARSQQQARERLIDQNSTIADEVRRLKGEIKSKSSMATELEHRLLAEAVRIDQAQVDLTLSRNESARLRGVIEKAHRDVTAELPVVHGMKALNDMWDARFPKEVAS